MWYDHALFSAGLLTGALGGWLLIRRRLFGFVGGPNRVPLAMGMVGLGAVVLLLGGIVWRLRDGAGFATVVLVPIGYLLIGAALLLLLFRFGIRGRHRLRWHWGLILVLCAMTFSGGWLLRLSPRIKGDGWIAVVPTTILISQLETLNDRSLWLSRAKAHVPDDRNANPRDWTLRGRVLNKRLTAWQERWLESKLHSYAAGAMNARRLNLCWLFEPVIGVPNREKLGEVTFQAQVSNDPQLVKSAVAQIYRLVGGKSAYQGAGWNWVEANAAALIPSLVTQLDSEDRQVRHAAVDTLSICGDAAVPLVPRFVQVASDPKNELGISCSVALWHMARASANLRASLIECAISGNTKERVEAIQHLDVALEVADDNVSKALSKLSSDPDQAVADKARETLATLTSWEATKREIERVRQERGGN